MTAITVAAPPTTQEAAAAILASMAGQSGVITDYNPGSQIRTLAEAIGEVVEEQGVVAQAIAFQSMVYAAYALFEIVPYPATFSVGTVTFSTPAPASQAVSIQAGTIVQTVGGTQFQTTATVLLSIGASTVDAPVVATVAGSAGNVPPSSISQIVSGLPYPLTVLNTQAAGQGFDIETPAQTLSRFAAAVAAIGGSSPVSIANSCIGVSNGNEIVRYATVYEPWIAQQAAGVTIVPGFQVYVDNGSGAASASLLSNVALKLNGNQALDQNGYRDAGMPYTISAVTPVLSSLVVVAGLVQNAPANSLAISLATAVSDYYNSLNFGDTVDQTRLVAAIGISLSGYVTSLNVTLLNSSGAVVTTIPATATQRNILTTLTQSFV